MHGTRRALLTAVVSGAVLAGVATTCLAASDTWPVTLTPGSSAETAATSLSAPMVTAACGSGHEVTISWSSVALATTYRLWESTSPSSSTTATWQVFTVGAAYSWTTTLPAGSYVFAVTAGVGGGWTSPLSTPSPTVTISTTPTAPCTVTTG